MSTQGIFDNVTINSSQSDPSIRLTTKESNSQLLWEQTRNKLDKFLPNLLRDLFPNMVLPPPTETTPTHIVTMTTIAMPMPGETPVESPSKSPSSSPLSTSPGVCVCVCGWLGGWVCESVWVVVLCGGVCLMHKYQHVCVGLLETRAFFSRQA